MTRNENNDRHGSVASSASWRSTDTIKAARGPHMKVRTVKDKKIDGNADISPGTTPGVSVGQSQQNAKSQIAPWDSVSPADLKNYRKDLAVLQGSDNRQPPPPRQPSTPGSIFPWSTGNGSSPMPSSVFSSFYNDSSDDIGQLSPSFLPNSNNNNQSSKKADDSVAPNEVRRPSVASATTVSSSGSKSSVGRGFHKKLQGFFGEEFPGESISRQNSEIGIPNPSVGGGTDGSSSRFRGRNNSINNTIGSSIGSRPVSPASSRPRTPQPSSEVTPWEYQDFKDMPAPPDSSRYSSDNQSHKTSRSHRLHFPGHGHRHRKSRDDTQASLDLYQLRPTPSRADSMTNFKRNDSNATATLTSSLTPRGSIVPRSSSPTPSDLSGTSREAIGSRSPGPTSTNHGKRSLLDKIRRKEKADKPGQDSLQDMPASSLSLQNSIKAGKPPTSDPTPAGQKKKNSIVNPIMSGKEKHPGKDGPRKDHMPRMPFMTKRVYSSEQPLGKDPNDIRADNVGNDAIWKLDTDLTHMEGIIHSQPPMSPSGGGEIFTGLSNEDSQDSSEAKPVETAWDAPDSWAVKRVGDENMGRLRLLDEDGGIPKDEDVGPPYCVRVFRLDSTFAVLSLPLNSTVSDIIAVLGKKTFLQDDLDNYQIVMRKHDTSRQLEPQERPVLIQKRLLEQAGYTDTDHIEDVGREDNSYLCRFTFLPAKMTGYASLEKDPGFNKMQKFSHIDLQGRNLITIPITLYQKATEIISLNLSRNLSLDVPKDFVQACTNLREIKYTSNDAWRLPQSLSLATRLTMLDISNNRLEQLEHAQLNKLQSLQGLRLSNNRLTSLPKYFGQYRSLRSLNLSSNSLSEFPDFLCEIRTLVDLDISFNSISNLPKIGQLTTLERIWATNNKLTGSFSDSIGDLVNLREIDIRFNAITSIDVLATLPNLEFLTVGHNSISAFEGKFAKLRVLKMNHNPVTRFGLTTSVPSLSVLSLASAKLSQLPDDLFQKISGLTQLVLDKNHFSSISNQVGRLSKLEHLSVARNNLDELPPEIGRLAEMKYLDVRENNLRKLPQELWFSRRLETLNVSSNCLDSFPKPPSPANNTYSDGSSADGSTPVQTPGLLSPDFDELGRLEDFAARRPSQTSSYLSYGSSPANSQRKGSVTSIYNAAGRKHSVTSKNNQDGTITPVSRKDSSLSNRYVTTFAGSLRYLYLADNRLTDDVFDELALMSDLRILNLSYNLMYDMPPRTLRRWQQLTELYLSGNDLSSLPAEDLEEVSLLKVLHINGNKFQVLPAELGKVAKLAILDVGNNLLKYNVSNWPYDWNWNWNHNLKYLNLSGNKRLEIKPSGSYHHASGAREGKDLTDFTSLVNLRVLGLMDVTMMVPSVPEQTEDRRVRTSGSSVGSMAYGMADTLGRNEHLSTMDMVIPKFRSNDDETVVGMFDGQALSSGGSKVAKYLYENFKHRFADELDRLMTEETPVDALRRTYVGLNKDLASKAMETFDKNQHANQTAHRGSIASTELGEDDVKSGSVATVLFLKEMELFVSNVGDAQALLIQSDSNYKILTRKHDPAETSERARIREAGGFVSRQGRLNDVLEVSRAFGYIQMSPSVISAPHIRQVTLCESDEMILLASGELWDFLTPDFAVDVARQERGDLMRAAQKLRDLAIAFGATGKIMVMIIGVNDLRSRQRARFRTHSMSMGPSGVPDEYFPRTSKGNRKRDAVADSKLARLDQEVEAPTGDVTLVFTDIKNSTLLWETYPIAMRSSIKLHNDVMRRQLRIIGGYEVKTEGDAFMVAFSTVTAALLWCFTAQSQLLEVPWPQEILNSVNGQEVCDADGNIIFRGLSVRMGVHWGQPVWERDPVTKRMDYFGPMVNRAARISSVADGGQITVSTDFIAEIQRLLETHIESDRNGSTGSEETLNDDLLSMNIRRELRALSSQGFEVKDLGERRLKGLENPEYIYLMYPHSLAGRILIQQQRLGTVDDVKDEDTAATKSKDSQVTIDTDDVWGLWNISLRLEMICSALESPGRNELKAPETALLERMKNRGGEITDRFLMNFVEHQISRIESCITTLALRNLVKPFTRHGMLQNACPMDEIFGALTSQLQELQIYRETNDINMAPS